MRNILRLALPLWALALLLSAASINVTRAQDTLGPPPPLPRPRPTPAPTPDDSDVEVVRVTSNLVVVPVSVTDAGGQPVLGLTAKDFRLEEEGRTQEIAQIGDPEQVPLEIAILLDVSGSVDARIDFEKQAAARFLKQVLKPGDRATVFAIDIKPRMVLARASAANASSALLALQPMKGPTAFYDAVIDAAQYLAKQTPPGSRRVIVVITDGEDNYSEKIKAAIGDTSQEQSRATPQTRLAVFNRMQMEVQRQVQLAEAAFYSINPSGQALRLNVISQRAQDAMGQLANSTGGTSFVPERLEDLDAVFRQITAELRSQYLLQYYSDEETQKSGKFVRIKVSAPAHPQLRVRSRQGYYPKRK